MGSQIKAAECKLVKTSEFVAPRGLERSLQKQQRVAKRRAQRSNRDLIQSIARNPTKFIEASRKSSTKTGQMARGNHKSAQNIAEDQTRKVRHRAKIVMDADFSCLNDRINAVEGQNDILQQPVTERNSE